MSAFEPQKIRTLLFDLDGTLIDSTADIAASANFLRASLGLPLLAVETIAGHIGDGVEKLVARVLADGYQGDLGAQVERFKAHYFEHCVDHTRLYPGVEATLRTLAARGYQMAVVTNKPARISAEILARLGVGALFGSVVGGNSTANKKPHPEPLQLACRELGAAMDSACMIGDSHVDVEAGINAGIPTLALLGGIGDDAKMLAQRPDLALKDLSELCGLFQGAP